MLNFRERRKLGVTFRNIRRVLEEEVDLEGGRNYTELSAEVLERIVSKNPTGWRDPKIDWGNIDWDALLSFIEKIIALIIRLFM